MSFLLGAFGKLAAGGRVRDLQARMMRVQSRLRRATRQCADMEKQLQRQEQMELNSLKSMGMLAKQTAISQLPGYSDLSNGSLTGDALAQAQAKYNEGSAGITAQFEAQLSFAQQQISDKYEWMREVQLEPLKMEENMLTFEKESLDSQIQLADNDYKACQKMEQADAKNLAPNYTGQG